MKHIQLFESFSSEPIQYKIMIIGCVPDGDFYAPGHWPIYRSYITVTLPEDVQAIAGTVDLFGIDLTEQVLKALAAGDFEVEIKPRFIQQIPEAEAVFGKDYLAAFAVGLSSLEDFIDAVQEQLYDVVSDWYHEQYGEDAEDDEEDEDEEDDDDYLSEYRINDKALRKIMFDDSFPRITRS